MTSAELNEFSESMIDGGLPPHWSVKQHEQFAKTFRFMYEYQSFVVHPDAPLIERDHWATIAWNAAVAAVDIDFATEQAVGQMVFVRTGPLPLGPH